MAQSVGSGVLGYVNYGYESAEGTVAASFPKCFGPDSKIKVTRTNNMQRVSSMGYRNAQANAALEYGITATIDFDLSANSSWVRAIMGAVPTDAGAGPYTHTFAESNSLVSFSCSDCQEMGTNDYVAALIGCKVVKATISAAVGEIAKVSLDIVARTESMANTGIGSVVAPTEEPLTFAHGTVSVAGTTVGYVQSVKFTLDQGTKMVPAMGTRYGVATAQLERKYDIDMTVDMSDTSLLLEKFYGHAAPLAATDLATLNPAGVACVLTFDNGGTTTASRKVVITLANMYFNTHVLSQEVSELTKEDVTGWALSCTSIVVTNNTATDVAAP